MQKGTLQPEQLNSLFSQNTTENPQGAVVNDGLSGNTHLLKSANNSVAYKNFTGGQIEETTLVQDEHNKTVQTDWTDEYDSGVTTTLTETAPEVTQQVQLNQSFSSTHTNLSETVNTTNEAHSINVPNWEAFHQTKQVQTPTKLDQTLATSGTHTVNNFQSQVQTQNIQGQTYTHQFGTLNMNGPVNLSGSSNQISGPSINIGGASNTSNLMPKSGWSLYTPPIPFKTISDTINFPPAFNGNRCYQITMTLEGDAEASNSAFRNVDVSTNGKEIEMSFQQAISNYFAQLQVLKIDGDGLSVSPTITIGDQNGNYTFSNGVNIPVISKYVQVYQYTNERDVKGDSDGWEFSLNATFTVTITISNKNNLDEGQSTFNHILNYLRQENAKVITNTKYGSYLYETELAENGEYVLYESLPFLVRIIADIAIIH